MGSGKKVILFENIPTRINSYITIMVNIYCLRLIIKVNGYCVSGYMKYFTISILQLGKVELREVK